MLLDDLTNDIVKGGQKAGKVLAKNFVAVEVEKRMSDSQRYPIIEKIIPSWPLMLVFSGQ